TPRPAGQPAPEAARVTLPGEGLVSKPVPVLPGDELLPLTNIRRRIAEHMVFSERVAPHVTTVHEADLHRVVAHRAAHKAEFAARGVRLTYTAYFVAAAAQALRRHPLVNSSWTDDGILLHKVIHIGIAVALGDKGLIVPVIKNADELSLLGIARALNDLTERARAGRLNPDEITGSTFSITNYGTNGSLFGTPIINQPNVAILGVGAIKKRVVVLEGDALAIRPMAYLSLTFDHRVLDGAVADAFMQDIVRQLEEWEG
ncbi:MAG: 2-oxo acid dehydrogenase subunit E2, partial [Chloroflexi bacterium]|nr:2-oxo acid dehydrogenase subunit E2 [Chloroflexota bacterium]